MALQSLVYFAKFLELSNYFLFMRSFFCQRITAIYKVAESDRWVKLLTKKILFF
jgi:hypothetical protein